MYRIIFVITTIYLFFSLSCLAAEGQLDELVQEALINNLEIKEAYSNWQAALEKAIDRNLDFSLH